MKWKKVEGKRRDRRGEGNGRKRESKEIVREGSRRENRGREGREGKGKKKFP